VKLSTRGDYINRRELLLEKFARTQALRQRGAPPSARAASGELRTARGLFVQNFARAGLATATAHRHAEAIFQVLKIGRTERRRLADFAFGYCVADTNVHI